MLLAKWGALRWSPSDPLRYFMGDFDHGRRHIHLEEQAGMLKVEGETKATTSRKGRHPQ